MLLWTVVALADPRWSALVEEAKGCRACPLWEPATQVVFGEGPVAARAVLVGEQPGDREDLDGRPFVGPAGGVLDRALVEAGVDRSELYVTNVVKHFKYEQRGKRRIHQTPSAGEQVACRPWLDAELDLVEPDLLVLLGATAARRVIGSSFRLTRHHGEPLACDAAPFVTATVHPSAVLRSRGEAREELFTSLVDDLRRSFALIGG